jgi:hypothetical protein
MKTQLTPSQRNLLNLVRKHAPIRIDVGTTTPRYSRSKIKCSKSTLDSLTERKLLKFSYEKKGYILTFAGITLVGSDSLNRLSKTSRKPHPRKSPEHRIMDLVFGK